MNIIERLIDAAARQCGFDRDGTAPPQHGAADAMPMTNALGFSVDSGDFARTFDRALRSADLAGFAARRAESEARGLLRGLGFAYHIKGTGGSPHENVDIRFETGWHGVADHRHADHRPGPRDDVSADPRRSAWHSE